MRTQFAPPQSSEDFAQLCLALLSRRWEAPDLQLYGTSGDAQDGIDIFDPRGNCGRAAQCKLHGLGKTTPPKEIRDEVHRAREWRRAVDLKEYWILTTGKLTRQGQAAVAAINDEQGQRRSFKVLVFGWQQIESWLETYDDVRSRFYKGMNFQACTTARFRRALVIGGTTGTANDNDVERDDMRTASMELGARLAAAGVELVVCSPWPGSVDIYAATGYANAGLGGTIRFYPIVDAANNEHTTPTKDHMDRFERRANVRRIKKVDIRWGVQPVDESLDARNSAWLFSQLRALEDVDIVIALGGHSASTANTILHLCEARRLPVLPFSFLGGAAKLAWNRLERAGLLDPVDHSKLGEEHMISDVVRLANRVMSKTYASHAELKGPIRTAFVSRATKQKAFGEIVVEQLRSKGIEPVIGDERVRVDSDRHAEILGAVRRSDLCIVLWSRDYALSRWCSDELAEALAQHRLGAQQVWLFNVDGSEIVPAGARRFLAPVVKDPDSLAVEISALLTRFT